MGFARFNLSKSVLDALTTLGYAEPTPIQAKAIPEAMAGHDLQACAQTGTGKTCAFVVPLIEKLLHSQRPQRPQALILTPTRELAVQVQQVIHGLIKHTKIHTALLIGGANFNQQRNQLRTGAHVVIATPGRLIDHLDQRTLGLGHVETLVLDEADRMLDMGFIPAVRRIVGLIPASRQTLFFSATFSHQIQTLVKQFLKNPIVIEIARQAPSENVTQFVYPVSRAQKLPLLQALLELGNMTSALIFTRTKRGADRLAETLESMGKSVAVIHGNRSQSQRQHALQAFKDRKVQLLVATDIAARGIDVKDISHVINFDVPVSPEDYVHRIGRTGRHTAVGEAFTLVSPDEEGQIRDIERLIGKPIPRSIIPDFPYSKAPHMFQRPQGSQHHRPHGRPHGPPSHGKPHGGSSHGGQPRGGQSQGGPSHGGGERQGRPNGPPRKGGFNPLRRRLR
jgi:ATP-dependent RNA helicase RhlE